MYRFWIICKKDINNNDKLTKELIQELQRPTVKTKKY